MATFVLVPGFWLGGWAWREVTDQLRAGGHQVYPVTLPGLAERAAEATRDTDVETHVADLVGLIEREDLRDVVLVGHSGANMPVTGAADRVPHRIARVVYVDSGPMPAGMGVIDFSPPEEQEAMRAQVAAEGDGWRLPVPDLDPAADPVNLAELTAEQLAEFGTRGTPQPFGTVTGTQRNRPDPLPAVPASVVMCTFTPDQARELASTGNPVFAPMAAMDMHHLPTGHWPMFSRPKELAAILASLA